jgi:hypothetical protein
MSENMLFCLGEGQLGSKGIGYQKNNMVFNKQVTKEEFVEVKFSMPTIEIPLTCWIRRSDMAKGGYLKTLSYEEAWAKWWSEAKQTDKDKILNCKYFDAEVFTGITGIKDLKFDSLKGAEVEVKVNGKSYKAIIQ